MTRVVTRIQLLALVCIPLLNRCSPARAEPALSSQVRIASTSEPGTQLIVTGRVIGADGALKAGVILEAHHTDATGIYLAEGATGPNPAVAARLWGRLATAADGTYRIDTIRPGAYPGGSAPAHIHIHLRDGRKEQWEILEFDDDPNLTPAIRARDGAGGTFATTRTVRRDPAGVLHVTRDFRLGGAR